MLLSCKVITWRLGKVKLKVA